MSRHDPRPYTPADDTYLLAAHAESAGYVRMARALGRSVSSVRGRLDRLRGTAEDRSKPAAPKFEPQERPCSRCGRSFETTARRRMLCAGCYSGGHDGGLDL